MDFIVKSKKEDRKKQMVKGQNLIKNININYQI